jgi:hypothetical protein
MGTHAARSSSASSQSRHGHDHGERRRTAADRCVDRLQRAFALLAARFDYPDILREPTADVLAKFRAAGTPLVLLWWAFALTALIPFAGHRPDASTLAIVSWATWRAAPR